MYVEYSLRLDLVYFLDYVLGECFKSTLDLTI